MNESGQQDIIQQLIDNTEDIIATSTNGGPEGIAALAHRQERLKQALTENTSHFGPGSRTSLEALQGLVEKAMDAVKAEMGLNRGSMQATGIKKKVLSAYGTVTVSDTPSR